jgi:nucleotide-binding universal stress UspA family protein
MRRIFGSVVTGLAKKTTIPLLVVPEGVSFRLPKAIAMAVDVLRETDYAIPLPVRQMADQFHSKMYIIRLFNKQLGEVIEILHQSANLHRTIGAFTPLCEIPADDTVVDALNDYIASSPIDLLVMRPHPRSVPERWFLRSNTRQMIFQTDIPLLILPGESPNNHQP